MGNNKITIGTGLISTKAEDKYDKKLPVNAADSAVTSETKIESEPLDEHIWGNEAELNRKLDSTFVAEKRKYTRVRFMQEIDCGTTFENPDQKMVKLAEPLKLMVIDISMGGLGALCEYDIPVGSVLGFVITMDMLQYEVKFEVVYSIFNNDKYRVGLKIAEKNKEFIRHLKILIARISLENKYGKDKHKNS